MRQKPAIEDAATENGAVEALPEDYYEQIKDQVRRRIAGRLRFAGRVLDLGCGSCELDGFLAEQNGQDVVGVDISDGSFPGNEALGERVRCRKADGRRLDFIQDRVERSRASRDG